MIKITSNAIVKYLQIKYGLSISKIKGEIVKSDIRNKYTDDFVGSILEKDYELIVKNGSIVTIKDNENTKIINSLPRNLTKSQGKSNK